MQSKNQKHILIHAHDSLTDIVRDIREFEGTQVLMYIPEGMHMLYNPVNLTLLSREVSAYKTKEIHFFSPDAHLVDLLRQVQLQAETSESVDIPQADPVEEDPFYDFFRYDSSNEFDQDQTSLSGSPESKPVNPNPKTSSKSEIFPWKLFTLAFGVAIITLIVAGAIVVPQANVKITPTGEVFSKDYELTFDPTIQTVNQETQTIPVTRSQLQSTVSRSFEATGTGSEGGSRAQGAITVVNATSTDQPLVETTRFQTQDGREYRTTEGVTVPAGGEVTVNIIANQAGVEYNVDSGRLTIPGLESTPSRFNNIYGELRTPISNGSAGGELVVSESDYDEAQKQLREALAQDLGIQATETQSDGVQALDVSSSLGEITFEGLPEVGTAQATFEASASGTLDALLYTTTDVLSILRPLLESQVLDNKALADSLTVTFDEPQGIENSDSLRARAYVDYTVIPDLNTSKIQADLARKSLTQAKESLSQREDIQRVEVVLEPSFMPFMPFLSRNINITISS